MLFTILSTDFGDNVDAAKKPDFTRFSKRVAASYRLLIRCLKNANHRFAFAGRSQAI